MAVVKSEDVRSGKPVISGTRVAVEDVVRSFYDAGRSVEEIAEDYEISFDEAEEALRYSRKDLDAGEEISA